LFTRGAYPPSGTGNKYLQRYTETNGEFMRIDCAGGNKGSIDGFSMTNSIVYGYRYGIRIISGFMSVSSINNTFWDNTTTALSVEGLGWMSSVKWNDNSHWSDYGVDTTQSFNTIHIDNDPGATYSNIYFTNNDFIYSRGHHIFWNNTLSSDNIFITGNRFRNWGMSTDSTTSRSIYAVSLTDSVLKGVITGNKLNSIATTRGSIVLSGLVIGGATYLTISSNDFMTCFIPLNITNTVSSNSIINLINNTTIETRAESKSFVNSSSGVVRSVSNIWDRGITGSSGLSCFSIEFLPSSDYKFSNSETVVPYNIKTFDNDNNYNITNYSFVCPMNGSYDFYAQIIYKIGSALDSLWQLKIQHERGASIIGSKSGTLAVINSVQDKVAIQCYSNFNLLKGDIIKVYIVRALGTGDFYPLNESNMNYFFGKRLF
jgi:hypothetical protein